MLRGTSTRADEMVHVRAATVNLEICRIVGGEEFPTSWDDDVMYHRRGNRQSLVQLGKDDNLRVDGELVTLESGVDHQDYGNHAERCVMIGKRPANSSLADFLFLNPSFVPNHWKESSPQGAQVSLRLYFWGTILSCGRERAEYFDREISTSVRTLVLGSCEKFLHMENIGRAFRGPVPMSCIRRYRQHRSQCLYY
jgi:hypothetical protein